METIDSAYMYAVVVEGSMLFNSNKKGDRKVVAEKVYDTLGQARAWVTRCGKCNAKTRRVIVKLKVTKEEVLWSN